MPPQTTKRGQDVAFPNGRFRRLAAEGVRVPRFDEDHPTSDLPRLRDSARNIELVRMQTFESEHRANKGRLSVGGSHGVHITHDILGASRLSPTKGISKDQTTSKFMSDQNEAAVSDGRPQRPMGRSMCYSQARTHP